MPTGRRSRMYRPGGGGSGGGGLGSILSMIAGVPSLEMGGGDVLANEELAMMGEPEAALAGETMAMPQYIQKPEKSTWRNILSGGQYNAQVSDFNNQLAFDSVNRQFQQGQLNKRLQGTRGIEQFRQQGNISQAELESRLEAQQAEVDYKNSVEKAKLDAALGKGVSTPQQYDESVVPLSLAKYSGDTFKQNLENAAYQTPDMQTAHVQNMYYGLANKAELESKLKEQQAAADYTRSVELAKQKAALDKGFANFPQFEQYSPAYSGAKMGGDTREQELRNTFVNQNPQAIFDSIASGLAKGGLENDSMRAKTQETIAGIPTKGRVTLSEGESSVDVNTGDMIRNLKGYQEKPEVFGGPVRSNLPTSQSGSFDKQPGGIKGVISMEERVPATIPSQLQPTSQAQPQSSPTIFESIKNSLVPSLPSFDTGRMSNDWDFLRGIPLIDQLIKREGVFKKKGLPSQNGQY